MTVSSSTRSEPSPGQRGLPLDGVCLGCGVIIWPPDFDRLVCLTADESQAGLVKGGAENAIFGVQGAGLGDGIHGLVAIARLPILFGKLLLALVEKRNKDFNYNIHEGEEEEWGQKCDKERKHAYPEAH